MPIKVVIVEDDNGLRESLAIVINGSTGLQCIRTCSNAEVALKEIPLDWPDVVLMDINLPQMSGIECVIKLKAQRPELQVIMLTVYVDSDVVFKALKAGASGYLIKQTPPAEIIAAVNDVCRGGAPMSNTIARKVVQHFHHQPSKNEAENLTKRENEILGLLAQGYQYKEIAEKLSISALTVHTHIRNIYEKLHVRSRTEAVVKFLGKETAYERR